MSIGQVLDYLRIFTRADGNYLLKERQPILGCNYINLVFIISQRNTFIVHIIYGQKLTVIEEICFNVTMDKIQEQFFVRD